MNSIEYGRFEFQRLAFFMIHAVESENFYILRFDDSVYRTKGSQCSYLNTTIVSARHSHSAAVSHCVCENPLHALLACVRGLNYCIFV